MTNPTFCTQELFPMSDVCHKRKILHELHTLSASVNHMQISVDKIISLCIKLQIDKN